MGGFAGPLSRLPEDYSKRSRKHDHGAASPRLQCMRRAVSSRIYPDRTRPCHDGELVKTRTGMSILDKIVARKKEELESNKKRLPASRLERSSLFRSEEHTSELQSLMLISYAVFCLKKKKN